MDGKLPGQPERVLAVGAHPDDLEILCGGTLAKYARQGTKVCMAIATDGSAGHMLIPPKELAQIRHTEAQKSADLIGAELYWLGFNDELIFEDIATRLRMMDTIRAARPDVIMTHDPGDYHPDHRVVSRLVFDASFTSGLPNIKTEHAAHPDIQPLYYFDTLSGVGFIPSDYVDISETFDTKRRMLECHASQLKWLEEHHKTDMFDFIDVMTRSRGLQCGVKYAEGFRPELAWGRARSYRLLP
ncbi:MAG TPA: PIG-L deacetylase family protein [Aggregatilineales bacterium]|nr:PIG-L deacetylase family protein [Aggregatilineales bacterium]